MAESFRIAAGLLAAALAAAPIALRAETGSPASAAASPAPARAGASRASKDLNKVLDGLQRHYQATNAYSAKFDEKITAVGAPPRARQGTVYFKKPGRMRWEFKAPAEELILSDGKNLYNYDPGLNQVLETPLEQALRAPGATEFLLGVGNLKRDFDATAPAATPADGQVHVALKPKQGGYAIELGLDPAKYDIRSLRLIDQLGNVTAIQFNEVNDTVDLADSLFTFTPPPGADIVRSTPPQ
ncbi:MAG TPA: outer membrane lipoprotein chaperone LolA [Candidatus Binataceae bacterium]|nr:outer membrane lipoprotein chaperone LolA [Candidatus Binataceae bacterium]